MTIEHILWPSYLLGYSIDEDKVKITLLCTGSSVSQVMTHTIAFMLQIIDMSEGIIVNIFHSSALD